MSEQPQTVEPMPVQLTRMEGTLNLVAYQVGDLGKRMEGVERRITAVEITQASSSGASASWRTWLPILASLIGLGLALFVAITGA